MTVFNPSTGIESINLDITRDQTLTTGTTGTDFAIVDNGTGDHKFNLPNASATARGVVSTGSQTIAGTKTLSSSTTFFGAPNSSVELRATIAGASSTGAGTSIYIEAADGGATSGDGGDINHQAGNAVGGNSNGGNHNYITGVKHGSGANGKHNFSEGTGNPVMTLNLSGLSTNRTLSAPDKSGIIAVTSDITATGTVTSVGLSSTNSTLTIGSTPVTTSGTITADINLNNANTYTALQTFNGGLAGNTANLDADIYNVVALSVKGDDSSMQHIADFYDGSNNLKVYINSSGSLIVPNIVIGSSSTTGYVWTATDNSGDGSWQPSGGATPALTSVLGAGNSAGGQSIIDLSTVTLLGNGHNMTLGASSSMSGDVSFIFPPDYGTNTYVLQTDGSGNSSWVPNGSTPTLAAVLSASSISPIADGTYAISNTLGGSVTTAGGIITAWTPAA